MSRPVLKIRHATRPWEPTRVLRGGIDDARELLEEMDCVVALTGAGISTDELATVRLDASTSEVLPALVS